MSSDQEYFPSDESACGGLRRSKRLTKYDVRKPPAKILRKTRGNAGKKSTHAKKNKKTSKLTEEKLNDVKEETESCTFSGEPLYPQELHQLFVKFREDGHFRCKSSVSPLPSPTVTQTTNDVTSNKKRKRMVERRTMAPFEKVTKKDNIERKGASLRKPDLLSVTLSNPLPNATGGTLHISTNKSQCVPQFLSECNNNWSGPVVHQNFLSSGSFRSGNGIDLSSGKSAFTLLAPLKQCQLASVANPCKTIFNEQAGNNAWKSLENSGEQLNKRRDENSRGFYETGKYSQTGYSDNSTIAQSDRSGRGNAVNSFASSAKLPTPLQTRSNNSYCGFDETGSAQDKFESRQMNMESSMFLTPTESSYGNPCSNWNDIDVNIQNILSNDNPSINDGFDSQSSINQALSNYRGYNTDMQNPSNVCTQNFGENGHSTMDYNNKLNGHHLSLMAWNSLQVYQNPYLTGSELSYVNNNYNCPMTYDASLSSMIVDESSNHMESTNFWSQKNSSNRGAFANDGNKASTTIVANTFMNAAPVTTTTINESTEITRISNKGIDVRNFDFDDFPHSQDGDFCPTVSSTCSYDDDISYENYVNDPLVRDNTVSKRMPIDHALNSGVLAKMKAELRPFYDPSTNYSQHNNNAKRNDDLSILYDFGTKRESGVSPNCANLDNSTMA